MTAQLPLLSPLTPWAAYLLGDTNTRPPLVHNAPAYDEVDGVLLRSAAVRPESGDRGTRDGTVREVIDVGERVTFHERGREVTVARSTWERWARGAEFGGGRVGWGS